MTDLLNFHMQLYCHQKSPILKRTAFIGVLVQNILSILIYIRSVLVNELVHESKLMKEAILYISRQSQIGRSMNTSQLKKFSLTNPLMRYCMDVFSYVAPVPF